MISKKGNLPLEEFNHAKYLKSHVGFRDFIINLLNNKECEDDINSGVMNMEV